MGAWTGILLPFAGTAAGAAAVFFIKGRPGRTADRFLTGCAAGIMAAAAFFSLLLPAIHQGGFWQAAAGWWPGMLFLRAMDGAARGRPLNSLEKRLLVITLHNAPEGMAVGAAYAASAYGGGSRAAALALAVGIALQNIPEGAIVSVPLASRGRGRAFAAGALSGAVEPLSAGLVLAAAGVFGPLLPLCMAFAAGAMGAVIVEEMIPQVCACGPDALGTASFAFGFFLMMALDVLL